MTELTHDEIAETYGTALKALRPVTAPIKQGVNKAEHIALREITKPRPDLIWRTAWGEVRSMVDAAIENFHNDPTDYNRGRMNALADASERLLERYVKS